MIKEINSSFVPVIVDLTDQDYSKEKNVRSLLEKYHIRTIPNSVVTLPSGQLVDGESYSRLSQSGEFLEYLI